jgi:MFS family permease
MQQDEQLTSGAEVAQPRENKRDATIVLGILFAVYLVGSMDRAIFGILAEPIKLDLLLADWQVGFLNGFAFSAVYIGFGIPLARVLDKGKRVPLLTACVAFWSIMTAVCGMAGSFVQLMLARMGVGAGEAGCLPSSHSILSDYYPPLKRTIPLAIFGLGLPVGSLVGALVGGILLDHWNWRVAFYVAGLPGLLLAFLTWRFVKEPQRGRFDPSSGPSKLNTEPKSFNEVALMMWRSPVLRHMIIALTIMFTATSPTAAFLGPYLLRRFSMSYTQLGVILAMTTMLGAALSTFFGGLITQRLAQRDQRWLLWFQALTVGIGTPFCVFSLTQSTWQALGILMFTGTLLHTAFMAPCFTVSHELIPPGGRAKAVVIITIFTSFIGNSAGPLIAGFANDIVASIHFGSFAPEGFAIACPGGRGAAGVGAATDAACREAMADATRWVLMATQGMAVWAAYHFFLAGRAMTRSSSS